MSLAKDGTVGVALGSTGGWGDFQQDLGMTGNIIVATLDLTNPRQPALITTRSRTGRRGPEPHGARRQRAVHRVEPGGR